MEVMDGVGAEANEALQVFFYLYQNNSTHKIINTLHVLKVLAIPLQQSIVGQVVK